MAWQEALPDSAVGIPPTRADDAAQCAADERRTEPPRDLARSALQPADADLRVHRLQLRPAALRPHQPDPGVAAQRGRRAHGDRALHADPAAVHLEVPVVAADGSLRAAADGPPPRLDARHAALAALVDRAAR